MSTINTLKASQYVIQKGSYRYENDQKKDAV